MSNNLVEQLVNLGHDHESAHAMAMRIPPNAHAEIAQLAARASNGEATIVQLADAIGMSQGCGRGSAIVDAERILHPGDRRFVSRASYATTPTGAKAAPAPVAEDPVTETARMVRNGKATIVHLADKIASERRIGRDVAFSEAERLLRAH